MKASCIAFSAVVSFLCIVSAPQSDAQQASACGHPALARSEPCSVPADSDALIVQPPVVVTWSVIKPVALRVVSPTLRLTASTN